jgi:hypothetical protein
VSTDDTSVLVTDRIETWKKINLINRDALFIMRKFFSSPVRSNLYVGTVSLTICSCDKSQIQ